MSIQSVLLLCSVPFVAILGARRASARGVSPDRLAHQIVPGLLIASPVALYALLLGQGQAGSAALPGAGLALSLVLVGALLGAAVAGRLLGLRLLLWSDICVPAVVLGQAAVSGGAAVTQGWPAALVFTTLWHLGALWALLRAERLLAGRLRPGDTLLLYGILAAPGAILGLALSSRGGCPAALDAVCEGALSRAPQLIIAVCALCTLALALRHLGRAAAAQPSSRTPR